MPMSNLDRMIQLADEFFSAKNDPAQISVDAAAIARLHEIHPHALSEERDDHGPIGWFLVLPTTRDVMNRFLARTMTEREMLDVTPRNVKYDALYLCSALVLPEHRGKGIATRCMVKAIASIQKDHPIAHLFYWAWSATGEQLATSIGKETGLPLHRRPE